MATKSTAPAKPATEVVTTTDMAFSQEMPSWMDPKLARGSENVSTTDLVLPRLEIVQAQSPIKDVNEDAREGMLFNSATGDLIESPALIVPVYFRVEHIIWKDTDAGGGYFGAFPTAAEAQNRVRDLQAEGETDLEIVDTPVHYCLRIRSDGSTEQIVVSMPKSKAKVSRKWNAIIQIAGGDRFSRVYKLSTFKDKNKKNQQFWNYVVQPAGFVTEPVYRKAEQNYEIFKNVGVATDYSGASEPPVGDSEI